MEQTYEKLFQLPLFLGMSKEEVTDLVGYSKLGFRKTYQGETIVSEHDACQSLIFLQSGEITVEKSSDRHDYVIKEHIPAPTVIEPERLFGLYQHYSRTYIARTDCHLITIQKADAMIICQTHTVFFLNLLGLIATSTQRLQRKPWRERPQAIEKQIILFLQERMLTNHGEKDLHIRMQTLASAIHQSRLSVSRTLNAWQDAGLLQIGRGKILIPAFEKLLQL